MTMGEQMRLIPMMQRWRRAQEDAEAAWNEVLNFIEEVRREGNGTQVADGQSVGRQQGAIRGATPRRPGPAVPAGTGEGGGPATAGRGEGGRTAEAPVDPPPEVVKPRIPTFDGSYPPPGVEPRVAGRSTQGTGV